MRRVLIDLLRAYRGNVVQAGFEGAAASVLTGAAAGVLAIQIGDEENGLPSEEAEAVGYALGRALHRIAWRLTWGELCRVFESFGAGLFGRSPPFPRPGWIPRSVAQQICVEGIETWELRHPEPLPAD
jgi:hypothetical protein